MASALSYDLGDFLLFSPEAYWRLFALHNKALWPLQLAALAIGFGIFYRLVRPKPGSGALISFFLAAIWLWLSWSYFRRYATINWAALYIFPFFILQGFLFIWLGLFKGKLEIYPSPRLNLIAGLALYLYALLLHPLIAPLSGRPFEAMEVFAIAPDPTVIATLGLLLMTRGWEVLLLWIVPLSWCAFSALTLFAMGAWEAWIMIAALLLALPLRLCSLKPPLR